MIKNTQQKVNSTYDQNFENIFGGKPPESGSFIQNKEGKLVPRETYVPDSVNAPMVMKPLKDFKSPIDGQIITSRSQLAKHNKQHGVTNSADYSGGYIANRAKARNKAGEKYLKETRRSDIHEAINQHT
tara:strand:- start:7550 stop:7936 length:387 start_codon:yes stop_codon:yes gene_type:complete